MANDKEPVSFAAIHARANEKFNRDVQSWERPKTTGVQSEDVIAMAQATVEEVNSVLADLRARLAKAERKLARMEAVSKRPGVKSKPRQKD